MSKQNTLTDHDAIKKWADNYDATPSVVQTDDGQSGILRFDMDGDNDDLEKVTWEHFFNLFEENKLALITADDSNFNKFVSR